MRSGPGDFPEIRAKLIEARAQRQALADELASLDGERIIALHPTVASDYRNAVAELDRTLEGESPENS